MIYHLKITMLNIEPPIWRRVAVDGECSLGDLHLILQIVMGWTNSHLHEFRIADSRYSVCDPTLYDWGEDTLDEEAYTVEQVVPFTGVEFLYEYDLGDSWEHLVKVKAISEPLPSVFYPTCLAGERSCPPEDVGGNSGYAEFLETLADNDHPEHATNLVWIGGNFDPEYFPIDLVNRYLSQFGSGEFFNLVPGVTYTRRQGQYLAFIHYYTRGKRHSAGPGRYSALLRRYSSVRKQHAQEIGSAGLHLKGCTSSALHQASPGPGGPSGTGIERWWLKHEGPIP